MTWYGYQRDSNHFYGTVPDPDVVDPFRFIDFEPEAIPLWKPIRLHISKERRLKRGNFPGFTSFPPIFDARALETLRPLLNSCDILPIDCPTETLVAINPPILSGALDHEKSRIDWFEGEEGDHALTLHSLVFRGEFAANAPIFRLAERKSFVVVSEAFRRAVETHNLLGLSWVPLDATWEL